MRFSKFYLSFICFLFFLFFTLFNNSVIYGQSVDELKQNINNHNDKIKQLEEEIKTYEKQIETVGTEAKSLQSAIQVLDINQKKIGTEIKKAETNIKKTNLAITDLSLEISEIENKILSNLEALSATISSMDQNDDISLLENLLTEKSLADIFDEYESFNKFQIKIREKSAELANDKEALQGKKTETEREKEKMVYFKEELNDQNQILANNKKEKNVLLTETKNKETEYKKILATKQAEKERAEKELFEFESKLKRVIDPQSFPEPHQGVLSYPLDKIFITQAFGKTADAKRLYVSGTHNGVDFRASRGTPIKAVLDGLVEGIGNTDEQKGCYSYGKWILIKHQNGLSSLYAHLDLIKVNTGQRVQTGQIIGYSGQTGYATGPHLHFTLYASQGVEIQRYTSSRNCKNVSIPMAPQNAYLDPMVYF